MLQVTLTGTLHEVDMASATLQRMELPPQEEGLLCQTMRTLYYAWCPTCGMLFTASTSEHVANLVCSHRTKTDVAVASQCERLQRISTLHACEF